MGAYYNDHDPFAAAWLRALIAEGQLPEGDVDERSILDVRPADLAGYDQCHFFAGIGGWPFALRIAGIGNRRGVWTGSPPCQPFSAAGKGLAADDPRHLAPAFARLVRACRPDLLFGEQVASADVFGPSAKPSQRGAGGPPPWAWCDDLFVRLEAAHYACGAGDIPSAGIGAPHIRQRCFFGAVRLENAELPQSARQRPVGGESVCEQAAGGLSRASDAHLVGAVAGGSGMLRRLADAMPAGRAERGTGAGIGSPAGGGGARRMADADNDRRGAGNCLQPDGQERDPEHGRDASGERPSPLHGFWRDADWLYCRDERWRPVEPGTSPLAHGIPARVGRLRGYGNAINPWAAAEFVNAFMGAAAMEQIREAG